MILRVVERCDPLRAEIEDYVRRVFAKQHAATVREFPDRLVAALGPDLAPLCAAGVRTSEDGFFSEFYLPSSVESLLGRLCAAPVQRSQVIEVTSLASERPGHAFQLLDYITQLGRAEGKVWGLFTATEKLRRCLQRSGMAITTLAAARAEAVPNRAEWGRYYDAKPMVCALQDRREQPLVFRPLRGRPVVFSAVPDMEAKPLD